MIWIVIFLYIAGIAPTLLAARLGCQIKTGDDLPESTKLLIFMAWPLFGLYTLYQYMK